MAATASAAPPAPFAWRGEHLAVELGPARALFTTRRGGVSTGPFASLNLGLYTEDGAEAVRRNREILAGEIGTTWDRVAQGLQVHETTVRRVVEPPAGEPREPADGQATALRGVPAVVLVADCLPVVLAAPGAVAVLHCGWRGLAGGIVAEGVEALRELAAEPGPLRAAIGPGIGPCCFEVGDEVRDAFSDLGADPRRGRNLDLPLIARRRLEHAGADEVHDAGLCTACHPELFFSHRRDRGVTGRQAGAAWLPA